MIKTILFLIAVVASGCAQSELETNSAVSEMRCQTTTHTTWCCGDDADSGCCEWSNDQPWVIVCGLHASEVQKD